MFAANQAQAKPERSSKSADVQLQWVRTHRQLLVWLGLVAAFTLLLWFAVLAALDRPIQRAEISGKFTQVSKLQIEQVLEPFAHRGFISIDLAAVKKSIEQIPWIEYARVERAWPDGLRVMVTEQTAIARWGEKGLLNGRGELFLPEARDVPLDLPLLEGPEGASGQVAKLYLDTYARLLAIGLRISHVALDERGAWVLNLSNGVEVRLGSQDISARLERFITAANVVVTRTGEVRYVDMRYSNGFSIGWGGAHAGSSAAQNEGSDDHV